MRDHEANDGTAFEPDDEKSTSRDESLFALLFKKSGYSPVIRWRGVESADDIHERPTLIP